MDWPSIFKDTASGSHYMSAHKLAGSEYSGGLPTYKGSAGSTPVSPIESYLGKINSKGDGIGYSGKSGILPKDSYQGKSSSPMVTPKGLDLMLQSTNTAQNYKN